MVSTCREIKISSTGYGGIDNQPFQLVVAYFEKCNIQCVAEFNLESIKFLKIVDFTAYSLPDVSRLSEEEFFQLSTIWNNDIDLYDLKTVQTYIHKNVLTRLDMNFVDKVQL